MLELSAMCLFSVFRYSETAELIIVFASRANKEQPIGLKLKETNKILSFWVISILNTIVLKRQKG